MRIYVITDRRLRPGLQLRRLIELVAGSGADMLQIREKDLAAAQLLECARRAVEAAQPGGPEVFVNGRVDVALAAGVAGVHLPAAGLPAREVRSRWGDSLRVGVSTHSLTEAIGARSAGADFVTFGPVFETESKRRFGPSQGVAPLARVVSESGIPVFAIGGINRTTIGRLAGIPLAGVAVVSAVIASSDMASAVDDLRGALE